MTILRSIPVAILLAAGLAVAQQPDKKEPPKDPPKSAGKDPAKPPPGSLEDTLEKALRNSADIKAAEAKILDAEAEANRVRSQVLTKATTLHANLNVAKRMLQVAEEVYARTKTIVERGQGSQAELSVALASVEKARGEVEVLETELKSLRGEFAVKGNRISSATFSPEGRWIYPMEVDSAFRIWDVKGNPLSTNIRGQEFSRSVDTFSPASPTVQPAMADRVRKLLDQSHEGNISSTPAEAMQSIVENSESRIPLRLMLGKMGETTFELSGTLTIGAWFQAIEDSDPNIRIAIRDYGLLLTTKDRLPEGAVRVADFWKLNETKKDEASKK